MCKACIIPFMLLAIGAGLFYFWHSSPQQDPAYHHLTFKHQFVIAQAHHLIGFDLVDPEQAPPDIRDSVMRGYRLITNTAFYAPKYAHDQLSCASCHFAGGDTLGGKNGGISLVGVTTIYPQYSQRDKMTISLAERINNCFERSMNGKPLPLNSPIMNDIINYLTWISKEVKEVKNIPWLGLPELKSSHIPNPREGQKIYEHYCQACHQADGQGGGVVEQAMGKTIPPLWGPYSFNNGAGMSTMRMLAPFVYLNMPFQHASLTKEQALDVAAFVLEQPRPQFNPSN